MDAITSKIASLGHALVAAPTRAAIRITAPIAAVPQPQDSAAKQLHHLQVH